MRSHEFETRLYSLLKYSKYDPAFLAYSADTSLLKMHRIRLTPMHVSAKKAISIKLDSPTRSFT